LSCSRVFWYSAKACKIETTCMTITGVDAVINHD
jgi:hypothetical protein